MGHQRVYPPFSLTQRLMQGTCLSCYSRPWQSATALWALLPSHTSMITWPFLLSVVRPLQCGREGNAYVALHAVLREGVNQLLIIDSQLGMVPDQALPVVALAPVEGPAQAICGLQHWLPLLVEEDIPAYHVCLHDHACISAPPDNHIVHT